MGIVNNQAVFIAPPLGEGEATTLTSFREDDDFSTDLFEESVVLPSFPNNVGIAFVRSSDSPADFATISLRGNNTSTVYIDNTSNNANLSVSGDVFVGYDNTPNFASERNSYFAYSPTSFYRGDLFVNGRIFAREWNFFNARMRGRTRFGLNTIEVDEDDNSITGIDSLYALSGIITSISGNNLQYQGISTFKNGPVLIGTGTSTGTQLQTLQVSGGAYISSSVGIGTTNPIQNLHIYNSIEPTDIVVESGAGAEYSEIYFQNDIGNQGWIWYSGSTRDLVGEGGPNALHVWNSANAPLSLGTNSEEKLRITGSGSVGIGTTTPIRKFEVYGDSLFTGESYVMDKIGIRKINPVRELDVNGSCSISGETYINGNVGIGVLTTTRKLEVNGNCLISGNITAGSLNVSGTKSFDIQHPTKKGYRLRYVCLEGPSADVYIRGKLIDSNVIEVPDYWSNLVDLETLNVSLTSFGIYQELYVEKIEWGKKIIIKNNLGGSISCNYVVYAERKDIDKNIPEYQSLDT